MTDYNQELYWREYQHRAALAAATAAASSLSEELDAKHEFVQEAFKDGATTADELAAVKKLLTTRAGGQIQLVDSTSTPAATVQKQFDVIVNNLSAVVEDGKNIVANIVVPENAGIVASESYTVPPNAKLIIGTYSDGQEIDYSKRTTTPTISGKDHLFKAEGGSIVINSGFYKVTGSNKYVIRSGYNPTDKDLKTEAAKIEKAKTLTGDVVINGGTFESEDSYVMTIWYGSSITINNGTFKSSSAIFSGNGNAWCANANLTIKGGTFEVANETVDSKGFTSVIGYWPVGNGKLTVNGGTFTINTPKRPATTFAIRAGQGEITGGTFNITTCDVDATGKVGDAKTTLPAGMFTVTSNAAYVGEPTAAITVSASKFTKPEISDIVVLDSVEPVDFDKLLVGTDQTAYSIKKFIVKDGEVTENTESSDEEVTQPEVGGETGSGSLDDSGI